MANTLPPIFTSANSANGKVGVSFSFTLAASGATSFTCGALPPGLSVNASTGVISGTPGVAGNYSVPISAASQYGTSDSLMAINIAA